jgi:hypothetical protein
MKALILHFIQQKNPLNDEPSFLNQQPYMCIMLLYVYYVSWYIHDNIYIRRIVS